MFVVNTFTFLYASRVKISAVMDGKVDVKDARWKAQIIV